MEGGTHQLTYRGSLPVIRPPGAVTPCYKCPKTEHVGDEERTRENAAEMTERYFLALRHYLECRAVGVFPDDPIVRRNAVIFRRIYDETERMPMRELSRDIRSLIVLLTRRS